MSGLHLAHRPPRLLAAAGLGLVVSLCAVSPAVAAPASSVVAHSKGTLVAVYRSPRAKRPFLTLRDGPIAFLVKRRARGWEDVYLPMRPNGATGWVRDRALDLALDPYLVVVSLSTHTLTVWKGAHVVRRERAGVGRSVTGTPTGMYYLVHLFKQPDPGGPYGPYAFALSAFSTVLYSFGGGPGQIGLHGTNEPSKLGTDVSHGCIRISNAGIVALARLLPLGTPVQIAR
jgi:lipoprotein-anchoring transpeptidase ErfK/SrfK